MTESGKQKQSGFTLIETLIAAVIFALFMAVAGSSLVSILRLEQKANVLRKTQQNARYILESIVREARSANGEFIKDGQIKERVSPAYQLGLSDELIILYTDIDAGKVTEKVYRKDGESIIMDIFSKPMGGDAFTADNIGVALNKTKDLKINQFDFVNGSVFYSDPKDINLPPFLHITIDAESGEGIDNRKPELRAHTVLTSSATPRGY